MRSTRGSEKEAGNVIITSFALDCDFANCRSWFAALRSFLRSPDGGYVVTWFKSVLIFRKSGSYPASNPRSSRECLSTSPIDCKVCGNEAPLSALMDSKAINRRVTAKRQGVL